MRLIPALTALLLSTASLPAVAKEPDAVCYIQLSSGLTVDLSSMCGSGGRSSASITPGSASSITPSLSTPSTQDEVDRAYVAAMVKRIKGNGSIGTYPAGLVQANSRAVVYSAKRYCIYRRQGMSSGAASQASRKELDLSMFIPDRDITRPTPALNPIIQAQATLAPQYYCPEMRGN